MKKTKWSLDKDHSEIAFKIRHLIISVTGYFQSYSLNTETIDEDFTTLKLAIQIDVNSIYTGNEIRDNDLRSPNFFEAETYPSIIFESSKIEEIDSESYYIHGEMVMKGISKPLTFKAILGGIDDDPMYGRIAGFSLEGKINRKEFGITFNKLTEAGAALLGEEVKIAAEIQIVKQA
jgi:polyisoprenoid-binding protein YceI